MRGIRCAVAGACAVCVVLTPTAPGRAQPADPGAVGSQPAQRLGPPGRTFTVAAVGDWLSEELVNNAAAAAAPPGVRYDDEPLVRPVEPLLRAADLAICHMETPIAAPGVRPGMQGVNPNGTHQLAAPHELAGDFVRMGFDRCSTASNHSNDLGPAGIAGTLGALDAAGVSHNGTARSAAEATVATFTVNGVTVAHLAYTRNTNFAWPTSWWSLNRAQVATNIIDDVKAARAAGAEVVILSLHMYVEMLSGPTAADRALVTEITAATHVDLVIMHGPHVIQPVERVHGTLVYWSLGNFISGMGQPGRKKYGDPRTLDGLMANVRFTQQPDGSWTTASWAVLDCNVVGSRRVYPALTTLADPTITATLRTQLTQCVQRTLPVFADFH